MMSEGPSYLPACRVDERKLCGGISPIVMKPLVSLPFPDPFDIANTHVPDPARGPSSNLYKDCSSSGRFCRSATTEAQG